MKLPAPVSGRDLAVAAPLLGCEWHFPPAGDDKCVIGASVQGARNEVVALENFQE